MKGNKVKLKKTLKKFDRIDIVDALDSLLMCFGQSNITELSEEAKTAHTNIVEFLRDDIDNSIQRMALA